MHPGDTYNQISAETGLSVTWPGDLNPSADPAPGQRLQLWRHPPPRPARPPGPRFWSVRPGDSVGLIADKTGIDLDTLGQLHPQLTKPSLLQPGDRVRLR